MVQRYGYLKLKKLTNVKSINYFTAINYAIDILEVNYEKLHSLNFIF